MGTLPWAALVRPGRDKPFDVPLTRETIVLRPVKWEVKDGVGILNVNAFNAQTYDQLEEGFAAIEKATNGRPLGYVLDLRSNPGGLLDQAVTVSDFFPGRPSTVTCPSARSFCTWV